MNQIETTWGLFQPSGEERLAWMARLPNVVGGSLSTLEQFHSFARRYGRSDCYFTPNPVFGSFGRRPSTQHVSAVRVICLDVDPIENIPDLQHATRGVIEHAENLLGIRLNPDRIDSGRGNQIWVRFEPVSVSTQEEKLRWRAAVGTFLHRLDQAVGVLGGCRIDTSVCDLPRLVRLPGTINTKTGRLAQFTHVGESHPGLYSTLLGRFGVSSSQVSIPRPTGGNWRRSYHLLTWRAKQFLIDGAEEPGRHSAAFAAARSLGEIGASREEIESLVLRGASRCYPPLDEWEARRCIRTALERGEKLE